MAYSGGSPFAANFDDPRQKNPVSEDRPGAFMSLGRNAKTQTDPYSQGQGVMMNAVQSIMQNAQGTKPNPPMTGNDRGRIVNPGSPLPMPTNGQLTVRNNQPIQTNPLQMAPNKLDLASLLKRIYESGMNGVLRNGVPQ